jgi:carboxyl-terminal processing protease
MRIIKFFAVILIAGLVGYYIGVTKISLDWKSFQPRIEVEGKEPPASLSHIDFSKFWAVMERVNENYYDKKAIDSQKMLDGAIAGMVDSLDDPYTVYLPPVQNTDFKQGLAGEFSGIGAELGMKDKQVVVVSPLDGSPAERAGIKAGDAIVKVNDEFTFGWSLNQTVEKIRGPKGTEVALTVVQKDQKESKILKIQRDTITIKSVTSWVKSIKDVENITLSQTLKASQNDKVAYIRLSQFGDNTNKEWLELSNSLSLQLTNDKSIKGIVLDLRNNPGGYLTDAVFIASEFLKKGTPVVLQDDGNGKTGKLVVERNGLMLEVPLVILINKGSASASEILAGAMQDYDRAILVGETSFGKGTIQNAEDLGEGAGLHVTIAKWLTPNGTWVHKVGLTPEIKVELSTKEPERDIQLEKALEELL